MNGQRMNNEEIDHTQDSFAEASKKEVVRKLQLFRAGSFHFGVFANDIAAIVTWRDPTPLPYAAKSVLGVVSVHGRMLTVLDLARLTSHEAASSDVPAQHLITIRGDEQLALAIETLGETIEIAEDDFNAMRETEEPLFLGVLHLEGAETNILNPKELFSTAIQGRERRRRRF
jgi:chemotaxis signal transduction protein